MDVGVEHFHLPDNFLQDITDARREDEKRDVVMVECVEESLIPLPGKRQRIVNGMALPTAILFSTQVGILYLLICVGVWMDVCVCAGCV